MIMFHTIDWCIKNNVHFSPDEWLKRLGSNRRCSDFTVRFGLRRFFRIIELEVIQVIILVFYFI